MTFFLLRNLGLNVIEQTENVMEMDCVQSLKDTLDYPQIHGWVFDMRTGKIVDLEIHAPKQNKNDTESVSLINRVKSLFKRNKG